MARPREQGINTVAQSLRQLRRFCHLINADKVFGTHKLSDCVDVGIVTGMDNARNNINILSSDVVIACGYGGSGTASEIALALKSGKPVVLLNERRECIDFFRAIGGKLVHESNSVDDTISHVKKLLAKV